MRHLLALQKITNVAHNLKKNPKFLYPIYQKKTKILNFQDPKLQNQFTFFSPKLSQIPQVTNSPDPVLLRS